MVAPADLAGQKRLLLEQSERNRRLMAEEVVHLRTTANWVQGGLSIARAATPVLLLLGPTTRFLRRRNKHDRVEAVREARRRTGWVARAITAVQWYRRIKPVLDHLRQARMA